MANVAFTVPVFIGVNKGSFAVVANTVFIIINVIIRCTALIANKVSVIVFMLLAAVKSICFTAVVTYIIGIFIVVVQTNTALVTNFIILCVNMHTGAANIAFNISVFILVLGADRMEFVSAYIAKSVCVLITVSRTSITASNNRKNKSQYNRS